MAVTSPPDNIRLKDQGIGQHHCHPIKGVAVKKTAALVVYNGDPNRNSIIGIQRRSSPTRMISVTVWIFK